MSSTPTPDLGVVIKNNTARKVVYGAYAVAAVVVGGVAVYFTSIGVPIPEPVIGAQGVVAYLGIPIGALALANTSS